MVEKGEAKAIQVDGLPDLIIRDPKTGEILSTSVPLTEEQKSKLQELGIPVSDGQDYHPAESLLKAINQK